MANDTDTKSLAIIPRTADEARSLARSFSSSTLLPDAFRGKEADVFVQIMAGLELGLAPMASLRGLHVVKGKPILSADTMVALVLGSGLAEYFTCIEEDANHVIYETKRRGSPAQKCTWSMEDAKRAGLDGDNWRKYPRAMLKARCKAMLARDVFPDVLAGCYDESERDEVERAPRSAPTNAIDADFVDVPSGGPSPAMQLLKDIEAAETFGRIQELLEQCKRIDKSDPLYQTIRKAWQARKSDFEREAAVAENPAA